MITMDDIQSFVKQVVDQYQPERVILFGSYAYGTPDDDSDVDLLVILNFEGHPAYKAAEILNKIHHRIPLSFLVRTPAQIQERLKLGDNFIHYVLEKGKVLYESNRAGVGSKS